MKHEEEGLVDETELEEGDEERNDREEGRASRGGAGRGASQIGMWAILEGLEKATPGNGAATPTPITGAPKESGPVGQWKRPTDHSGRRKYLEVKEQHGVVTLPTGGGA